MKIGGLQRFSLIDYPENICAIIFTQGCNFRCPYCHNPELSHPGRYEAVIPEEEIFSFLERRRGKLDAVSITGGEPTEQGDLIAFIEQVKAMGYLVKIDTNGSHPEVLKALVDRKIIDYIAMDVKAPPDKYKDITRATIEPSIIRQSIQIILKSGLPHEFRTTVVRSQLDKKDIAAIARLIKGADRYVLQKFVPTKVLDQRFMNEETWSDKEFSSVKKAIGRSAKQIIIR
ncbi:MAG: anaerobic ribonucleoside-triphosphate reductase activating protein [Deltaproteobacteria bacterium]|nr:anaerobic ribonucleoside-triphosphate reductase activating protein [Deltaproteobacteria bacterium]MBN2688401.1 anaerobic ribonucleoside-triphosphate reductase activating protein [Deltaproteobacteria bacterium]